MLAQGYPAPQAPAPLPEGLVQALRDWDATVHKIKALENQRVEQSYAAADQALKRATGAMKEKEKQVASATQKVETSEKAAEKADDPNFFKKIINSIRKDKAEEEARLAHEQLEKDTKFLELRGLSLVDRQAEYQRASKLVSELKVKVNELTSLRQKEESIVNAIFAPSYCPLVDANEAGLRTAVAAVTPKLQAMDGYKKTYVGALNHLLKGGDILTQAAQTLERALALNGIGMMGNVMRPGMGQGMGGFMMDVMEQQRLAEGVELAKMACKKIKKAKEMCPDVPRIDLKKLEHLEMGLAMFNMLFGSVLIDLVVRQKINQAYESVLQMLDDVKFGAKWMESTLNTRFKSDYEALVSEQAGAQGALMNYRRTLIFNALASLAHPHPAPGVPAPPPVPAAAPAYAAAPAAPAPWTMWDPSQHDDDDD